MKKCTSCGKLNDEEMQFCEECGTVLASAPVSPAFPREDRIGGFVSDVRSSSIRDALKSQFQADKSEIDAYAQNVKTIVPDKLALCEGEIPVKQFFCATERLGLIKLNIYHLIQVTNKRVIYCKLGNSMFGPKVNQEEVPLSDISSVSIKRGFKISVLALLGVIISFFGFFVSLFNSQPKTPQPYGIGSMGATAVTTGIAIYSVIFFLILFVISLLFLSRRYFKVCIGSKSGSNYPICSGDDDSFGKLGAAYGIKGDFLDSILSVKPTQHVERLERELNAMILDIQNLGDYGIDKWLSK